MEGLGGEDRLRFYVDRGDHTGRADTCLMLDARCSRKEGRDEGREGLGHGECGRERGSCACWLVLYSRLRESTCPVHMVERSEILSCVAGQGGRGGGECGGHDYHCVDVGGLLLMVSR